MHNFLKLELVLHLSIVMFKLQFTSNLFHLRVNTSCDKTFCNILNTILDTVIILIKVSNTVCHSVNQKLTHLTSKWIYKQLIDLVFLTSMESWKQFSITAMEDQRSKILLPL